MRKIIVLSVAALFAVLVLTAANPTPTAAAAPMSYYVVRPGDTLAGIAWQYGLSSWAIARANGIWDPNYIYVGQMLVIPYGGYCPTCNHFPGGYYPYPQYPQHPQYPQYPQYPRSYGCYYWVRYGDSLSTIAWRYGGDAWAIARANGLYNLNWIYAGQRLYIPGCN